MSRRPSRKSDEGRQSPIVTRSRSVSRPPMKRVKLMPKRPFLIDLPPQVLVSLLQLLDVPELVRLCAVNRYLSSTVISNAHRLRQFEKRNIWIFSNREYLFFNQMTENFAPFEEADYVRLAPPIERFEINGETVEYGEHISIGRVHTPSLIVRIPLDTINYFFRIPKLNWIETSPILRRILALVFRHYRPVNMASNLASRQLNRIISSIPQSVRYFTYDQRFQKRLGTRELLNAVNRLVQVKSFKLYRNKEIGHVFFGSKKLAELEQLIFRCEEHMMFWRSKRALLYSSAKSVDYGRISIPAEGINLLLRAWAEKKRYFDEIKMEFFMNPKMDDILEDLPVQIECLQDKDFSGLKLCLTRPDGATVTLHATWFFGHRNTVRTLCISSQKPLIL